MTTDPTSATRNRTGTGMSRGVRLRPEVTGDSRLARARERFLTREPVEPGQVREAILASWRRCREWHVAAGRIDWACPGPRSTARSTSTRSSPRPANRRAAEVPVRQRHVLVRPVRRGRRGPAIAPQLVSRHAELAGWRNSVPAGVKRVGPVVSQLVRASAPIVSAARMTTVPAVLRPGSVPAGSCRSHAAA